jgi:hypothetical protein
MTEIMPAVIIDSIAEVFVEHMAEVPVELKLVTLSYNDTMSSSQESVELLTERLIHYVLAQTEFDPMVWLL